VIELRILNFLWNWVNPSTTPALRRDNRSSMAWEMTATSSILGPQISCPNEDSLSEFTLLIALGTSRQTRGKEPGAITMRRFLVS
jgi:hypothetical protein